MISTSAYLYLSPKLPPAEDYRNVRLVNPLRIYSADDKLIAEFGEVRRDPVKYNDIPQLLVDALIASEDTRFYQHNGVDLKALGRSVLGILSGNPSGGGSTLTMQLAKNISFEGESPYSRKFKEILLALKIERELNKEEILELYLNRIFFGISAYGVSAASSQFYNKTPNELSLSEMAMLIALLPAPNTINPLRSEQRALTYRNRVLRRMLELSMITQSQFNEANDTPLTAQRYGVEIEVEAPYIAEMVRLDMEARYGSLAITDGFEVYTTVNSETQAQASQALTDGLENYDRNHGYRGPENHMRPSNSDDDVDMWLSILARTVTIGDQEPAFVQQISERSLLALLKTGESITIEWDGIRWAKQFINNSTWTSSPRTAGEVVDVGDLIRVSRNSENRWMLSQVPAVNGSLVSINPNNGAILALAGGYDFYQSNFNRVTQARRQPGSNFKPFLYAAALENGYTAASLINDAPLDRSDYRPENFGGEFLGPISLKYALTNSKNLVSLRLYDALGDDLVMPYIARFGLNEAEFPRNDLTVAIGSHALTPMAVASAYTVFANGGYQVQPYLIERIENFNDGNVYQAQPALVCQACEASFDPENQQDPSFYPAPRVIDEDVAYIMNTMLRSVITNGSGRRINREIGRSDLAGKTGTTNDNFDLWFSGFNGDMVTTVYIGFDSPQTLGRDEQAATVAVPIWIDFMEDALNGMPINSMAQPDGIVTVRINPETGFRAQPNEEGAIFEVFREESQPLEADNANALNDPNSLEDENDLF
ncbi:MAG: peptidase [SAR86 cluster bacterium]|uniref:Penicillin-binding protein 1A n=1 Tax=SAR86 cluster bacterium TaxID=2030880 RepID=A0A2A5CJQ1_9GAMM|nr:PBP1A family penicillin-binding protein [Gammaproteobacteria bacterium AH-315-E17]PCJ43748.1 MAG: peptidase [SAR86 cluster bacterium]